ncbi:uncharacterized protein EI97DRAFT_445338 [Westerdykella ornata]|uniref:Adenylate kinase n=1 Tax=Westerdykella ornata TaxID=318751 RepID=A0A6A6JB76_WESOR|nr:uncharacterized protein EI97DRAFT_445338 [Westerdykella ornata]KAF2272876.1 hypothetical protein EI97DRAFT_445338 [Westerdykella ornata]
MAMVNMNANRFAALLTVEPNGNTARGTSERTNPANRASREVFVFLLGPSEPLKVSLCRRIQQQIRNLDIISAESILNEIFQDKSGKVMHKYHLTEEENREIEQYGNNGVAIPTATMVKIMEEAIFPAGQKGQVKPKCLIEGFPRSVQQWREFKKRCKKHGRWPGRPRCFFIAIEPETAAFAPSCPGGELGKWSRERNWSDEKDALLGAAGDSANEVVGPIRVDLSARNVLDVAQRIVNAFERNAEWKNISGSTRMAKGWFQT